MAWLTGLFGFVFGALVVWVLARLGIIQFRLLGTIEVTSVKCVDATTIEVAYEAIPEGDETLCKVLAGTYIGGGTPPTPDQCTQIGSESPFRISVPPGDTRLVLYGVFDSISGPENVLIPTCSSSSSGGGAELASQPNDLP